MRKKPIIALAALAFSTFAHAAPKTHLLVISIDGMRPDYVTEADKHGLKVPNLRRFIAEGAYAEGVNGVIPTLTYPSHTTIMTGVWPLQHGIYGNQKFDPEDKLNGAVITDYNTIKVQTLWNAAKKAGYTVGSVGWPVTTGTMGKDFNWITPANAQIEGAADGETVSAKIPDSQIVYPADLLTTLQPDLPKQGNLGPDEHRFAWTLGIMRRYKPELMTTHLVDLDHAEHEHGPFSPEANATLERIDKEVGEIIAEEKRIYPDAYVAIVSDHGFQPVNHTVSLPTLFAKAGLLAKPWKVAFYPTGGTVSIILADPNDKTLRDKISVLLHEAAANKEYGIRKVMAHDEVVANGGNPNAAFVVGFESGYSFYKKVRETVVVDTKTTGTHGYFPDRPEIRATFMIMGPNVAKHRDLGVVDMRQEAPTFARLLHVSLPAANQAPINIQ